MEFTANQPATLILSINVDVDGYWVTSPLTTPAKQIDFSLKLMNAAFDANSANNAYKFKDYFFSQMLSALNSGVKGATVRYNFLNG